MSQDLDLYASNVNWKAWKNINWKKAVAVIATVSVVVAALGFFGYRWLTTSTPMTRAKAVEMFQEESKAADAEKGSRAAAASNSESKKSSAGHEQAEGKGSGTGGGGSSPDEETTAVAAGSGTSTKSEGGTAEKKRAADAGPTTPAEGVYSWSTDGWEEAQGIRRDFPEESQRIITASDGDSFKQHHYFSEEREIWSEFVITEDGAHVAMQRNKAKFGPVTNDSRVDFSPPMLVGKADPKVGEAWKGSWEGKTSGDYTARVFDHGRITIGDETLEVWGYEIHMEMRGELNGTVDARVLFSPKYALTVQEHYKQHIESGRTRYRAEWTMQLKSTTPQR